VLQGACLARIETEERLLRQWDFRHSAPGTRHGFVAADDGPCVLLLVGARFPGRTFDDPEQEAEPAHDAYVNHPQWRPARSGRAAVWRARRHAYARRGPGEAAPTGRS
jgi:hypothetical protein